MKEKTKWTRIIFIIGVIALILGAIDPMEGSVVIAAGSGFLAVSSFFTDDRHKKIFITSFVLILTGVCFLFFFSFLGGIGGKSSISMWWGVLILPYPAGWLLSIVILIIRAFKKPEPEVTG